MCDPRGGQGQSYGQQGYGAPRQSYGGMSSGYMMSRPMGGSMGNMYRPTGDVWNAPPPPTNGAPIAPDGSFPMPTPWVGMQPGGGSPNRNVPDPGMTGINPYDVRHEVSWPGMGGSMGNMASAGGMMRGGWNPNLPGGGMGQPQTGGQMQWNQQPQMANESGMQQAQAPQQAAPQAAPAPFANLPGQNGLATYDNLNASQLSREDAFKQNADVWAKQATRPDGSFDMQKYIQLQHGYYDRAPNPTGPGAAEGLAQLGLNSAINGFRMR